MDHWVPGYGQTSSKFSIPTLTTLSPRDHTATVAFVIIMVLFEEEDDGFVVETPPSSPGKVMLKAREAAADTLTGEPLAKSVLALFNTIGPPDILKISTANVLTHNNIPYSKSKQCPNKTSTRYFSSLNSMGATRPIYPPIWTASSCNKDVANKKKCPLCKRQKNKKLCIGGPPCDACKRKGRTEAQCRSDEPPKSKLKRLEGKRYRPLISVD